MSQTSSRRSGCPCTCCPARCPTPITAFAVRRLGAAAGVVVTASHNPPADNGYKVYAGDGAQIIPPDDTAIATAAAGGRPESRPTRTQPSAKVIGVDDAMLAGYRDAVLGLLDPAGPRQLRAVYTPMHGVGGAVLPGLLDRGRLRPARARAGAGRARSRLPDAPVPEPRGARRARPRRRHRPSGPAPTSCWPTIPTPTGWRSRCRAATVGGARFTGDELGILLADRRLQVTAGDDRLVATTVVSSSMLSKLAAAGRRRVRGDAHRLQVDRPGGAAAAGSSAGLRLRGGARLHDRRRRRRQGRDERGARRRRAGGAGREPRGDSLLDRLDELSARLGVHATAQWSYRAEGQAGIEVLAAVVDGWRPRAADRARWPGGQRGRRPRARRRAPADRCPDRPARRPGRVVLRPSGTEPKLKAYLEVTTEPPGPDGLPDARRLAAERLAVLREDVAARCTPPRLTVATPSPRSGC